MHITPLTNVFYVEKIGTDVTGRLINNNANGVNLGKCPLTITGITADNKPYDGNTDATFNNYSLTLSVVKSGDVVTLLQGNVEIDFSDKKR